MGMDATLLAIGKYTPAIVDSLDYPADFYADTPVGATIIVTVGIAASTEQSKSLARALGINPWQFQEHCDLSGDNADLGLLAEDLGETFAADFLNLRAHGFRFYYLPNG